MSEKLPRFASGDEERELWDSHDASDYVDWSTARPVTFPDLRPSVRTISLRLPVPMLEQLKMLAHERDVPYQSLLKLFVAERLRRATGTSAAAARKRGAGKAR